MERRRRGTVGLGLLAALFVACVPAAVERPPNVVLIVIDTLRADALGAYGAPSATSPEIDALAAEGVLFERVVAPSSWTRPSAGALLTGVLPRTLGLFRERNEILPDRFSTLAEILRDAGYTTLGASANPSLNSVFNFHQGFETYRDSVAVFTSYMERAPGNTSYAENGLASAESIFEGALDWVREKDAPDDFPFYLQLNVMEVHEYFRGEMSLTRNEYRDLFPGDPRRDYLQAVRQTSAAVDTFVRELTTLPGWRDTLFVLTSDHGEGLDSHPSILSSEIHGTLLYESQVLVPLILYHPDLPASQRGRHIARPVRLLDVMPTVLDWIGVEKPEGLDGRSLLPLLSDAEADVDLPRYFVTETYFRSPLDKQAVYADEWNYFEHNDGHPGTSPRELQRTGGSENGKLTNRLAYELERAETLRDYLREWNDAHPKSAPTPQKSALSDAEREQLEAIGYLN